MTFSEKLFGLDIISFRKNSKYCKCSMRQTWRPENVSVNNFNKKSTVCLKLQILTPGVPWF